MKLCKDCHYFVKGSPVRGIHHGCCGPHIAPSVITGEQYMRLPGARYSRGEGLLPEVGPCGESEATHWKIPEYP